MRVFKRALGLAALPALLLVPLTAEAAPAPSGTNAVFGRMRFTNANGAIRARLGPPGNEGMGSFVVFAATAPPDVLQSTTLVNAADKLDEPYEITVAADDSPRAYTLYAYLALDSDVEEYWTALRTAPTVTSNSPPAELNLDECVALVELRFRRADGSPVTASGGRATAYETASPNRPRARYARQPAGRTENFFAVPSGVELELTIEVDIGTDIYLNRLTHRETFVRTFSCDEKPVLTITIPDAGALGKITGSANLVGEQELPTDGDQELLGRPVIKANGPAGNQRYASLGAEWPGPDAIRAFTLENLVPSTATERWNVAAEMQFGTGYRFQYFRTPGLGEGVHNPGVTVTAGATTSLGSTFVMTPARMVGRVVLAGPLELLGKQSGLRGLVRAADYDAEANGIPDGVGPAGIGGSYVILSGQDELVPGSTRSAVRGQGIASFTGGFNAAVASFIGDYEIAVGMLDDQPGVWKYDGLNLAIEHPGTNGGPFVSQAVSVVEDTPWRGTLSPGARVTNHLSYGLAEVCVRLRSPAPFFSPRVINSVGAFSGIDWEGRPRAYHVNVANASAPPYAGQGTTTEATVTLYLPEGTYTLQPAISVPDAEGNVSEVQLPVVEVSVVAGERYCPVECIQLFFESPICTTNQGFLGWGNAVSTCGSTLTNISVTIRPLSDPSIRLGYAERWLLGGDTTNQLRMFGQVFPDFDGFLPTHPEYYQDMVWTVVAKDILGNIATRQAVYHFDFTAPTLDCPGNTNVVTADPLGAVVEFEVTTTDDRPEPIRGPICIPPSGSLFPVGTTTVTCQAIDLCKNTNTCSFTVTVGTNVDCALGIALARISPREIKLTWECPGTLQCADDPSGPWRNVAGATSPYVAAVNGPRQFYRLCISGECLLTQNPPQP